MTHKSYSTLHPLDEALGQEFQYGNMHITRKRLDTHLSHSKGLVAIYESYREAGIIPHNTYLIGDYLEHVLVKSGGGENEIAGRYLGIVLPNGNYQYVRLEGESIGVKKRNLKPPDEIDIITDTCLFCTANATAELQTGEEVSIVAPKTRITAPVNALNISERMCLYEIDTIVRLSDLIHSLSAGNDTYKKAFIAMPTVEYYFYLMGAYNKRFVEKDTMRQWINTVNLHAKEIVKALSKRIDLDIQECQPLNGIKDYVESCVDKGLSADFERVNIILSQESKLWHDVLNITKPKSWHDLNYANYAVAVLKSALIHGNNRRLTINIENPSEQRILRNAAKLSRKLTLKGSEDTFRVIGIYPHEKVFIPISPEQHQSYPRLYYSEQYHQTGECYHREIVEANRRDYSRLSQSS